MFSTHLPAIQVVLPLLFAPVVALFVSRNIAWLITTIVTVLAFAVSLGLLLTVLDMGPLRYAMGNWDAPFGIEYRVDLLAAYMLCLVSGIGVIAMVYARKIVRKEVPGDRHGLFYSTFLLCLAGLLGIIITNDAFNIYVFLEISSLAMYALIAMGTDRRALVSAFEYLILGTIGATFILIAVGLLYMATGTLNISDLYVRIPQVTDQTTVKAALVFFIVGLALKIAIFPLHVWLANSYTNAPSFISVFLSATATKVSIYLLIRIIFSLFGYSYSLQQLPLGGILITLTMFAVLIPSLVAVFQHNVKRMLAYSSVAQIGYMVLGISLATKTGLTASLIHLTNHALAKAALFMAVGCVLLRVGGVRLSDFRGVGKTMPYTMAGFLLAGLSLIGIPFTAGFISKWYLLSAVIEKHLWLVFVIVVVSSLLAIVYVWRVVEVAYFRDPVKNYSDIREAPLSMLVPMWLCVLLSLVLGVYTYPTVGIAELITDYIHVLR